MAMNFGGLGFAFGATDSGAQKISSGIANSLENVWEGLQKVGPAAVMASRKVSGGFNAMKSASGRALGGMAMAVTSAIESAQNPKLDAPYAEMFASFDKSFNKMSVGMKLTRKESTLLQKQVGSAAFGLNEDMDAAAQSVLAFRKQNVDLTKALGSKGTKGAIKDLIKVTSVYEIEGQQLSNVFSGLIKGFDFTEERVGSLADKIVAAGRHFNMGKEAVQAWPAILESLNNELADFGRTAKPEDIEALTTSIVSFGGGLKDALGMDAQSALELARTTFTTIMGERKNLQNMFRGREGEMGDFSKQLIESGGDVNQMFKMIQGDPLKFMENLRKMAAEAEKAGGSSGVAFQRLSGQINESLGPNVTFAMKGNWDKVADSMNTLPAAIEGSKGAFVGLAKASHRTAITAQEGWERMKAGVEAKLMSLSKDVRGQWVRDMSAGFKKTSGVIAELAHTKGPVGQLTQRLLLVKDVGLSALLPELGKLSPLFGGIATSAMPVLTAIGSMGVSFSSLGKMAIGGGALFILFKMLKDGPDEAVKSLKTLGKTTWEFVTKLFPGLTEFGEKAKGVFEQFNKDRKKEGLVGALKNMLTGGRIEEVGKFFTKQFKTLSEKIDFKAIFSATTEVGGAILGWFSNIDFGKIFELLSKKFASIDWGGIITKVAGMASLAAKGMGSLIRSFFMNVDWTSVAKTIGDGLMSAVIGLASIAGSFLGALFAPGKVEKAVAGPMHDGIMNGLTNVLTGIASAASGLVIGATKRLFGFIFDADSLGDAAKRIIGVAATMFAGILLVSKGFRSKMSTNFTEMVGKMKAKTVGLRTKIATEFNVMKLVAVTSMKTLAMNAVIALDNIPFHARAMGAKMKAEWKGVMLEYRAQSIFTGSKVKGVFSAMAMVSKKAGTKMMTNMKKAGTKIRSGFTKIGTAARGMGAKVGGAMKGLKGGLRMFGGIGMLMGLIEAMDQIKVRMKNIGDITTDELIPNFQKVSLQGEQAFLGIGETIDKVFLGLPSQVGNALGITSRDLSNFYHDMSGGFEVAIASVVYGFESAMGFLGSEWDTFKAQFLGGWQLVKDRLGIVWSWIEKGWHGVVRNMEGVIDGLVTTLDTTFTKIRHAFERVFTSVTETIANMLNKIPNVLKEYMPKKLVDFAEKNAGKEGMKNLKTRQQRELQGIKESARQRELMRKDEARADDIDFAAKKLAARENAHQTKLEVAGIERRASIKQRQRDIDFGNMRKEIDIGTEAAKKESERAEQRKKDAEEDARRKKKRRRGGEGGAGADATGDEGAGVPSTEVQATARQGVLPPGMVNEVAAMAGNINNLSRNMSEFIKKPLNVIVEISSRNGLRRQIKGEAKLAGRTAQ